MTHRLPKPPITSRIIAVGCIALWVVGVSACDLEALFCCDTHGSEAVTFVDQEHSHDTKHAGKTDPHDDADVHHSCETDDHSHDSPEHGGKEGSCCSTLKAVAQTSSSVLFKPSFEPLSFRCKPMEAHATSLARLEGPPKRHAQTSDRVFMPEVCLGSAFHSNAPPDFG